MSMIDHRPERRGGRRSLYLPASWEKRGGQGVSERREGAGTEQGGYAMINEAEVMGIVCLPLIATALSDSLDD